MHAFRFPRQALSVVAHTAFAVAASISLPSLASAQASDAGYGTYRCVVLGDSHACPVSAAAPANEVRIEIVPGPYASYLKHLGQDSESAIYAARGIGEVATQRTVRVSTRPLSAEESHDRYLGRLATPETSYTIVSEAPVEAPTTRAGSKVPKASAL